MRTRVPAILSTGSLIVVALGIAPLANAQSTDGTELQASHSIESARGHGSVNSMPMRATAMVNQALRLLGQPGQPVFLYDPQDYAGKDRAKLEQYEAFVLAKRSEIYLNRRGAAVTHALAGRPEGIYVIAAILTHERAHLHGANEREALAAEERCVYDFMRQGKIPIDLALAHLRAAWALR